MPITKVCRNCGSEFKIPPSREKTAYTCSRECKYALHPKINSVEVSCLQCGKKMHWPVSRVKRGNGKFCSKDCRFAHMRADQELSDRMAGDKNPRWIGGVVSRADGYIYRRDAAHPMQSNSYVLEHRLVIEEELRRHDPSHPFLVDGYLSHEISVHHRDRNRANNDASNLMAITPAAHSSWHNTGRIPEPWECWPNVHPET